MVRRWLVPPKSQSAAHGRCQGPISEKTDAYVPGGYQRPWGLNPARQSLLRRVLQRLATPFLMRRRRAHDDYLIIMAKNRFDCRMANDPAIMQQPNKQ
jgi:hypothetical protein